MNKFLKIAVFIIFVTGLFVGVRYFGFASDDNDTFLTLYGNIDIRQVELTFHDPEHIAEIYVEEGDQVKKGQLLAIQDLERFQLAVESAEAKLESQRQIVDKLVTGTRPEDILKAKADVKSAEAQVVFLKKELQRQQKLLSRRLASKEAVDKARSEYVSALQKLNALKEQLKLAIEGPRKEDIAQAKAVLKANQSALKLAEKNYQDAHLYAPDAGIIQDRILEPGDMADYRTPVLTLAKTNPVWARVYVPEKKLGTLRYGLPASISTDSFPDKSFKGWVGFISPTAEFTPKTVETPELRTSLVYQVRVFACNADHQLLLGMPVTVSIDTQAKTTVKGQTDCAKL